MNIENKIKELNIILPKPKEAVGNYSLYKICGNNLYISGQGPMIDSIPKYHGKIGKELSLEEGYAASALTALNVISVIKLAIGDLDKVKQFVYVTGYVNCTDDFIDQPKVINGFSDTIIKIFGDKGKHARCAVPSNTLPMNTPVEIQVIVEI
jgi:enamine deaminase RidA (YjgF/YER057c/UK114 family)